MIPTTRKQEGLWVNAKELLDKSDTYFSILEKYLIKFFRNGVPNNLFPLFAFVKAKPYGIRCIPQFGIVISLDKRKERRYGVFFVSSNEVASYSDCTVGDTEFVVPSAEQPISTSSLKSLRASLNVLGTLNAESISNQYPPLPGPDVLEFPTPLPSIDPNTYVDPLTWEDAMSRPTEAPFWVVGRNIECRGMEGVLQPIPSLPHGHTHAAVPLKEVFKLKFKPDPDNPNNSIIDKFRVRIVGKGFKQQHGLHFDDTFAPTPHLTTVRIFYILLVQYDLKLKSCDAVQAFLNSPLDRDNIYVKLSGGMKEYFKTDYAVALKGLYGLKQAAMLWNRLLFDFLRGIGLKQSIYDLCLWYIIDPPRLTVFLLVQVDDILCATSSDKWFDEFYAKACAQWEFNRTKPDNFLQMTVSRTSEYLELSVQRQVEKIASQFGVTTGKAITTPMDPQLKLETSESADPSVYPVYVSLIGSLWWWCRTGVRCVIEHHLRVLSKFSHCAQQSHLDALLRVLRYVYHTRHYTLRIYKQTGDKPVLLAYTDAAFANCFTTLKSYSGYIVKFYGNLVSFGSILQPEQAHSTGQSEYIAASVTAREVFGIYNIICQLEQLRLRIPIFIDSTAAQCMLESPAVSNLMRHVAIQVHWVKELVQNGKIKFFRVPSCLNESDIMTALPKSKRGTPVLLFLISRILYVGQEALRKAKLCYESLKEEITKESNGSPVTINV